MAASQDNHGIEAYFTPAEFERFSDYEKLRFSNMKQNYEMMIKVGLNVPPPDFMSQSNRKNTKLSSLDKESKDANMHGRRESHKKASSFKVPLKRHGRQKKQVKKPETVSRAPMYDSDDAFEQLADITIGASDDDEVGRNIAHDSVKKDETKANQPQSDTDGSSHPCELCPGVAFTSRLFYLKHLKYRHHQHVDLTLYQSRSSPHIGRSLCKMVSSSRQGSQDSKQVHTARTVRIHDPTSENRKERVACANDKISFQLSENTVTRRYGDGDKNGSSTQKHVRHSVGKCHKCDICGQELSSNKNLIKHMRVHTGEKPFQCTKCEMGFNDKGNLNRHIRGQHEGIKLYKCQYCQRQFTCKDNLEEHIRIHTGEKPYKCRTCGKGFAEKSNLVKPERIHSGIKPFQCAQCNKTFKQQNNLI